MIMIVKWGVGGEGQGKKKRNLVDLSTRSITNDLSSIKYNVLFDQTKFFFDLKMGRGGVRRGCFGGRDTLEDNRTCMYIVSHVHRACGQD